ncbi:Aerobic C4-dicarboxylate transport protein [Candidatus Glomeribacter gigasporarum BEG34]|uniref:Aerobic C4-dicarboxylate transport protein n=1 Tax=Candidatus Glomeribacter gigasporarum BEG34 TaxID=1070319 RepID=G2JAA4_9BURK|nr:dicarboxylate/amino acid:cation symporter [Candidatus Glomeribacter gigasporarum]CCD29705.1 Aerobic C4-dicarboxylate transport protein [Candidatus Glomeribacter gigasporarum BEG34]
MKNWLKPLYIQVLFAIAAGIALGTAAPEFAVQMKPLGDAFIKLIKMVIGPVVFCTVVSGIAGMQNMKQVGRVSGKALLYFETISTLALLIGLGAAHLLKPGASFNVDPSTLDANIVSSYAQKAQGQTISSFLLHIIPDTLVSAFTRGDMLQILLIAVLFGYALSLAGERGQPVFTLINALSRVFFGIMRIITKVAPIGAFGAIAFSIGHYGLASLLPQLKLIGVFYLSLLLFITIVLGGVARIAGFSLLRFIAHIKDELLIVFSTSSSEAALPALMNKLERLGCSRSVVGLVVPAGYSCNLDGTNLYMTMAVLFIAQATNTDLTLMQQLTLLAVAMLTSKGASGVAGAGFITLAATLSVVPTVPLSGMVLLLGIDRFMADGRAISNFIGNGVATIVISAWEKQLDRNQMKQTLDKTAQPVALDTDSVPI